MSELTLSTSQFGTDGMTQRAMSKAMYGAQQATGGNSGKITKSAEQFEAILLENWLQQAEKAFATIPGGDDSNADPGRDQYQGIALQSLATSFAQRGGIGIAKMIAKSLQSAEERSASKEQPADEASSVPDSASAK